MTHILMDFILILMGFGGRIRGESRDDGLERFEENNCRRTGMCCGMYYDRGGIGSRKPYDGLWSRL